MMDQGGSQCPGQEDHGCKNDQIPVDPELVWDLFLQLDPQKAVGSYGIHPRILNELTDVTKPRLMIFEQSWESKEVPADWKLVNIIPVFKIGKKKGPEN